MKQKRNKWLVACLVLIAIVIVGGYVGYRMGNLPMYEEEMIGDFNYDSSGMLASTAGNSKAMAFDTMESMNDVAADSESFSMTSASGGSASDGSNILSGMIHYSGYVTLQTLDYDRTMSEVQSLIQKMDGVVISSSERDSDANWYVVDGKRTSGQRFADFEIRVPSKLFQEMYGSFGSVTGKVTSQSVYSEDMTRSYNSNNDRLDALKAEQAQILKLMESADTTESLLLMYEHLTDVNTEISSLETHQNDIEYDADYATVYLTIESVKQYEDDMADEPFVTQLWYNLKKGGSDFVDGVQAVVLSVAMNWALLLFVFVVIIGCGFFTWKMKHSDKKERREQQKRRMEAFDVAVTDESGCETEHTDEAIEDVANNPDKTE